MYVLREVVRELPALARVRRAAPALERVGGDDVQVEEERGDEGGDQRGGGAEPRLVHVREAHARLAQRGQRAERVEGRGEVLRGELAGRGRV